MDMLDFTVEWDGSESETLAQLLEKKQQHSKAASDALNHHLLSMKKKSSISEVIALWMGYTSVPESLKNNALFMLVLAITSLALISPRSLKLIPDAAGEVLEIFESKGFHRTISLKKLEKLMGNKELALQGLNFLLELKLVAADGGKYRLLEVPLSNLKISGIHP